LCVVRAERCNSTRIWGSYVAVSCALRGPRYRAPSRTDAARPRVAVDRFVPFTICPFLRLLALICLVLLPTAALAQTADLAIGNTPRSLVRFGDSARTTVIAQSFLPTAPEIAAVSIRLCAPRCADLPVRSVDPRGAHRAAARM
jgi:hypothetical protein